MSEGENDLILNLYIQPGAKKTQWCGLHNGELKLRLKAPPVEGKANLALIDFLAKTCEVKKQNIIIESGELSRHKRVRIVNPGNQVLTRLQLPTNFVSKDNET